ncbi:uncharacterized protein LOC130990908 [Salvia miltiorrhiza]|uniref:uncharacterized protein LOC130990908 n=1 Tax=Salvia miltiorrhiza TaxID=226208 RepID=UPI0025AC900B|nr:uncharacterized protein LOC130990908 [Salvia miltiorrhiza]
MGKGFFTLKFKSMEDKKIAKAKPVLELTSGCVRLREWTKFFDPYKESSSIAQIWVRIYNLPLEFWHPEVIAVIGRAVGHPIRIESSAAAGAVGHFARVLIEVDLSTPLLEGVYIDEGTSSCYVKFSYESMPLYCSRCRITGHTVDRCRRHPDKPVAVANESRPVETNKSWQSKDRTEENLEKGEGARITSKSNGASSSTNTNSNRFAALTEDVEVEMPILGSRATVEIEPNPLGTLPSGRDSREQVTMQVVDASPVTLVELPDKSKLDDPKENSNVNDVAVENRDQANCHSAAEEERTIESASEVKALAVENAMKIQRLEQYLTDRDSHTEDAGEHAATHVKRGRGRPPGVGRGRGFRPISQVTEESIKHRLRQKAELGLHPRDFVVDSTDSAPLRATQNVGNRSWADEVEAGEHPLPKIGF